MLLPLPAVRATLKLANPAQRFAWAADQLIAGSTPSPAIPANLARNIPAKAINTGLVAPYNAKELQGFGGGYFSRMERPNYVRRYVILPYSEVQLVRGVPLLKCIQQIVAGSTALYIGGLPDGSVAVDTSTATTVEEYCLEQFILAQPELYPGCEWQLDIVQRNTDEYKQFNEKIVAITGYTAPATNNNEYSHITSLITPV